MRCPGCDPRERGRCAGRSGSRGREGGGVRCPRGDPGKGRDALCLPLPRQGCAAPTLAPGKGGREGGRDALARARGDAGTAWEPPGWGTGQHTGSRAGRQQGPAGSVMLQGVWDAHTRTGPGETSQNPAQQGAGPGLRVPGMCRLGRQAGRTLVPIQDQAQAPIVRGAPHECLQF